MLKGDLQLERLENLSDASFPLLKRVTNLLFPFKADFIIQLCKFKDVDLHFILHILHKKVCERQ